MAQENDMATRLAGDAGRSMPNSPEAEKSILSAMMISSDALETCLVKLRDKDFYTPSNRRIFLAMNTMFDKNITIEPISLADFLRSTGDLERVGGLASLLELGSNTFSLANWPRHIEMVRRDSTLRELISAGAEICALAFDAPEDTKEVIDRAESVIFRAAEDDIRMNYSTLPEIAYNLYEDLAEQIGKDVEGMYVQTGFSGIDKRLLGLRPGQMIVIGARPGVGKTSFALSMIRAAASKGASIAFFSLEMSREEIAQRMLSMQSGVALSSIRAAKIRNEDWEALMKATEELATLDVMVDDTPGTTVTEIRAKARRMLHNKEKGLIVIDYLQLVSPPPGRRADNRANEVSEMSRGIKIMAKDLGVPVIALSQLNRGLEQRGGRTGKRPQLSDLRESGSIEQDADIVILLDRSESEEEAEREGRPDMGITRFIIAKNRSGETGDVELVFVPERTQFLEVDYRHQD